MASSRGGWQQRLGAAVSEAQARVAASPAGPSLKQHEEWSHLGLELLLYLLSRKVMFGGIVGLKGSKRTSMLGLKPSRACSKPSRVET